MALAPTAGSRSTPILAEFHHSWRYRSIGVRLGPRTGNGLPAAGLVADPPPPSPPPPTRSSTAVNPSDMPSWGGSRPSTLAFTSKCVTGHRRISLTGQPLDSGQVGGDEVGHWTQRQRGPQVVCSDQSRSCWSRRFLGARCILGGMRLVYHGCQEGCDDERCDPPQEDKLPHVDETPGPLNLEVPGPDSPLRSQLPTGQMGASRTGRHGLNRGRLLRWPCTSRSDRCAGRALLCLRWSASSTTPGVLDRPRAARSPSGTPDRCDTVSHPRGTRAVKRTGVRGPQSSVGA